MENVQLFKGEIIITQRSEIALETVLMWLIVGVTYIGLAVVLLGKENTWTFCCWLGKVFIQSAAWLTHL